LHVSLYQVEKFSSATHQVDIIAKVGGVGCASAKGKHNEAPRWAQHKLAQLREGDPLHWVFVDFDHEVAFFNAGCACSSTSGSDRGHKNSLLGRLLKEEPDARKPVNAMRTRLFVQVVHGYIMLRQLCQHLKVTAR
jgi:hypothetical protein